MLSDQVDPKSSNLIFCGRSPYFLSGCTLSLIHTFFYISLDDYWIFPVTFLKVFNLMLPCSPLQHATLSGLHGSQQPPCPCQSNSWGHGSWHCDLFHCSRLPALLTSIVYHPFTSFFGEYSTKELLGPIIFKKYTLFLYFNILFLT